MKRFVNLNNFWSRKFAEVLQSYGIKNVCISPGSRSTPLTAVFASNKFFLKHVIIDERSSGFFALGIAKALQKPVVLITTSGTAVAELYPAIIEAYQQRIPLIICTADRPDYLIGRGANQTINQKNIYVNHIRFFADLGLPTKKISAINKLQKTAERSINICRFEDPGPVHLNFPFEKPLEPSTKNIEITDRSNSFVKLHKSLKRKIAENKIIDSDKTLFMVGWDNYPKNFNEKIIKIAGKNFIPIIADGASQIRFTDSNENVISNASAFLYSENVRSKLEPEIIVQFGNAPTSNTLLNFFKLSKAEKILVNEFGDWKDPSNTAGKLERYNPIDFLDSLQIKKSSDDKFYHMWQAAENESEKIKSQFLRKQDQLFEGRIIPELLKNIPAKSNLIISNSLPIRDFDLFSGKCDNEVSIFTNRGASGIDGIISTALGISKASDRNTYLLIGDLAFLHDTNGLLTALNYKIPLNIILVNNSGGAIFEMLPVINEKKIFQNYFKTPQVVDFSGIAKTYGAYYKQIKNWKSFSTELAKSSETKNLRILELNTSNTNSTGIRMKYKTFIAKELEKYFD